MLRVVSKYMHTGSLDASNQTKHQMEQSITMYVNAVNVIHFKSHGCLWFTQPQPVLLKLIVVFKL